ncbi:MAG: 4-alpha-glucanotransferase, partial [Burkholderiaceae bacterium]
MAESWRDEQLAALHRLCGHYGIAMDYHDVWGLKKVVDPGALLALVAEFDAAATTPEALTEAWLRACDAVWNQSLAPVVAIRAGDGQWAVALRMPATATVLRWQLRDERDQLVHAGEVDARSVPQTASTERAGVPWCERQLALDLPLAAGYYQLQVEGLATDGPSQALVVCAPPQCYRPPAARDGGRVWGLAVQLYTLRSQRNWGIGDFGDLAQLARLMAARGGDMIGLNPLHALFTHNPAHASPYSPSSRRAFNVLYIDVPAVAEFAQCAPARQRVATPEFQQRLARLRLAPLVDYPGVAAAKLEILALLHTHFAQHHLEGARATDAHGQAFLDFVAQGGDALRGHALFEAIQARLHADDPSVWGWPMWPAHWRDPHGDTVLRFSHEHADEIR